MRYLESLKPNLSEKVYQDEYQKLLKEFSDFMNYPIRTDQEAESLLIFFADERLSAASRVSAFLLFMKFLMILASIAILVSVGYFFRDWIVPLLQISLIWVLLIEYIVKLPYHTKSKVLFVLSLTLIPLTKKTPIELQPYLGLFSTFLISLATLYLLQERLPHREYSNRLFNSESVLENSIVAGIFAICSIIFNSALIGFFTVVYFYICLGFVCFSFWGTWCFGFERQDQVKFNVIFSGVFLAGYILGVLTGLKSSYFHVFENGIFFCSTFIYFLGLLIWQLNAKRSAVVHILIILSGLVCFGLGSLTPELSLFRGVGTTFFTLYLMELLAMIEWGPCWSFAIFIGGCLVLGYAGLAQKYWTYIF